MVYGYYSWTLFLCYILFWFRFAIRKFDLKTPGRDAATSDSEETKAVDGDALAVGVLEALGGKENLLSQTLVSLD